MYKRAKFADWMLYIAFIHPPESRKNEKSKLIPIRSAVSVKRNASDQMAGGDLPAPGVSIVGMPFSQLPVRLVRLSQQDAGANRQQITGDWSMASDHLESLIFLLIRSHLTANISIDIFADLSTETILGSRKATVFRLACWRALQKEVQHHINISVKNIELRSSD